MKDHYRQYVASIKEYKPLSANQERSLFIKIKKGNSTAREIIFNNNLNLVVKLANKYANDNNDIMDLIMAGNVALLRAIDNFNIDLGCRFSSYAYVYIENSMLNEIANTAHLITVPNAVYWELRKFKEFYEDPSNMINLSIEQLAINTNLSKEKVFAFLSLTQTILSLDRPEGKGNDRYNDTLCDYIEDPNDDILITENNIFLNEIMELLFGNMQEREILFIKMHYGIGEYNEHTCVEIGLKYGLSRERVRQILDNAKKRLRENTELAKMVSQILIDIQKEKVL